MAKQRAYPIDIVIAVAVLAAAWLFWLACCPASGQDRSGVITGGRIPNQSLSAIADRVEAEGKRLAADEQKRERERAAKESKSVAVITPKPAEPVAEPRKPPEPVRQPRPSPLAPRHLPQLPALETQVIAQAAAQPAVESQPVEITITGPSLPVSPNTEIVLTVGGLSYADLERAAKTSEPRALLSAGQLSGRTILSFLPSQIGVHTVTVSIQLPRPGWLDKTEEGLAGATAGQEISASTLARYKSIAAEMARESTTRSSTCVVQVGHVPQPQPIPPPQPVPVPPRPTPPVPPTPGPVVSTGITVVVIRITDDLTADQSEVLANLRQWSDQPGNHVPVYEYTPQGFDENGNQDPQVAGFVKRIPEGISLPYAFIARWTSGGGGVIPWQGPLPASADVLIAKIKEHASPPRSPLIPRGNSK